MVVGGAEDLHRRVARVEKEASAGAQTSGDLAEDHGVLLGAGKVTEAVEEIEDHVEAGGAEGQGLHEPGDKVGVADLASGGEGIDSPGEHHGRDVEADGRAAKLGPEAEVPAGAARDVAKELAGTKIEERRDGQRLGARGVRVGEVAEDEAVR